MQPPMARFVRQRETVAAQHLGIGLGIETGIHADDLLLDPQRPQHVAQPEQLFQVCDLKGHLEMEFEDFFDGHRRRRDGLEFLADIPPAASPLSSCSCSRVRYGTSVPTVFRAMFSSFLFLELPCLFHQLPELLGRQPAGLPQQLGHLRRLPSG
jgi:hypothetical protein